jgi:hypothetical protein
MLLLLLLLLLGTAALPASAHPVSDHSNSR